MAIIQEPIAVIDERLTEYETARRKKARAVILEYMQKAFEGIEQQIADKAKNALYDDRWENATAKKSEWQTAIDARAEQSGQICRFWLASRRNSDLTPWMRTDRT